MIQGETQTPSQHDTAGEVMAGEAEMRSTKIAVLATAQAILAYDEKRSTQLRCLCDSGAQVNLIALQCANELNLKIYPTTDSVIGIGGHEMTIGVTFARVHDRHGRDMNLPAQFVVVRKLPAQIPSSPLEVDVKGKIPETELAGPAFREPAPIQVLLGAGAWARIVEGGLRRLTSGLIAQHTRLGWTIFGENAEERSMLCHITQVATDQSLDAALRRLWEADSIEPREHFLSPDEKWCEDHFAKTHYRDHDGRYTTTLSIKPGGPRLGSSFNLAAQRFRSLERRFAREPEMAAKYIEFMKEYESLDHMRAMPELNPPNE